MTQLDDIGHWSHREPKTWVSLLRTIRAPFTVLVLAGLGLLVPPQTADMLAALGDERDSLSPTILFHFANAMLALSAWYWSRALLAARFDVPDNKVARRSLQDVGHQAYDVVPHLMYILAVLLGLGVILRSEASSSLFFLFLWAIPLGFAVYFRTALMGRLYACLRLERPADQEQAQGAGIPKTSSFCTWLRSLGPRIRLLVRRAPWPNWLSMVLIFTSLAMFVWGSLDAFVPWFEKSPYRELPALAATAFPGPAVALFGLAMMIAPLSVLTFLFDGLDISILALRMRVLRRPPVVTFLVAWVLVAPTLFSLHTVRVVAAGDEPATPGGRQDLSALFKAWAAQCAPSGDKVRPIIVAVSGGASRAAVWGERVLSEIEADSGPDKPRIFAISSVSGGSLGVAAYMSALAALPDGTRCSNDDDRRQQMRVLTNRQLSEDALGPLLAGALLVDIPRAIFTPLPQVVRSLTGGNPRGGDRAEALEHAFEHLWSAVPPTDYLTQPIGFDAPYLSLFYTGEHGETIRPGMPIWIANGTDMATGSRLITAPNSPKGAWPFAAAADVLTSLGADVPISTAINNTARFPYLEPSGELLPDEPSPLPPLDQRHQPDGTAREIVDGGYFDNEGLQTALDLADWLSREGKSQVNGRVVEPIIVQATADGEVVPSETVVRCEFRKDDPAEIAATRRPLQLLAPVSGLYNVRGGHSAVLLRATRAAYCPDEIQATYNCDEPNALPVRCTTREPARQRFFHFYLPADGATPVALNWILSDSTARFIWDGAMKAGGNPREAQAMRQALAEP